jgi:diguanylate cyclase (GGDEF)-like protein
MSTRGWFDRNVGRSGPSPKHAVPSRAHPSPDDLPPAGLWDHLTSREREAIDGQAAARPSARRPQAEAPASPGHQTKTLPRLPPLPQRPEVPAVPAPPTGLPNRRQFERELQSCAEHARFVADGCALLIIDLDRFGRINHSLGQAAGNQVLVAVAERLRVGIRSVDMAAHLGGDVFAVLLAGVSGPDAATCMARKITATLGLPIEVGDDFVMVTASVGVALYGADGRDPRALMTAADAALARAKRRGGQHIELSHGAMPVADHGRPLHR